MSERVRLEHAPTEALDGSLSQSSADSFDDVLREMAHVPTPQDAPRSVPVGSLIAGKFRVERSLGQGGMGAVYAVRHELTRHRRALKLLHAERSQSPEIVQRFLAEASAAGRTGSPHLVETYDAGILPSGEPYLVMEFLEGLTFGDLLARDGVLSPELACELVAQAAEGMSAAHQASIVHRDLKPDNLFIVQRADGPFVKILDFGISKFSSASLAKKHSTQENAVFGTPAYMAPEQLQNAKDVDERADVFALGAVLFECLGGESPYDAGSMMAVVARLMSGQSTPLESLRPGLHPELLALVRRAIAADPAQRTPTAQALLEELAPFRRRGTPSFRALARDEDAQEREPVAPTTAAARKRALTAAVVLAFCVGSAGMLAWWTHRAARTQAAKPAVEARPRAREPRTEGSVVSAHPQPPSTERIAPEQPAPEPSTDPIEASPGTPQKPASTTGSKKIPRASTRDGVPAAPPPTRSRAKELGLFETNPYP